MKNSTLLAVAFSTAGLVSQAFAQTYTSTGTTAGISVSATLPTVVYYTAPTSGASDPSYPAIVEDFTGDWTFTFNPNNTVDFTGNINLGDYETQTNVTGFITIDGHQQYFGVNQAFSGTGNYDPVTRVLTYNLPSGGANSSIASTQTQTSASCVNGATSIFGTVCGAWASTTAAWEGLSFTLTFSPTLDSFVGTVTAIEQSGAGLTANTTTVSFNVAGTL